MALDEQLLLRLEINMLRSIPQRPLQQALFAIPSAEPSGYKKTQKMAPLGLVMPLALKFGSQSDLVDVLGQVSPGTGIAVQSSGVLEARTHVRFLRLALHRSRTSVASSWPIYRKSDY